MAAEVGASAGAQQQITLPPEGADITNIQDEDLLRRMWQATEDFGRKREIRARMYKLRERRLKEFYTTGEVLKDLMSTTLDGSSEAADSSAKAGGVGSTVVTTTKTTYAASEGGDSVGGGGGGLVVTSTETIRGGDGSQDSLVIRYRTGGNEDENQKNLEMDRRQLEGSTELIYESGGKTTRSSRTQMSSSSNSQTSMISKSANYGIHSQSLADQGFMTLKSKEIRDSESPTRDFIPTRQLQQTSVTSRGGPGGGGGYWYEESRSYHTGDDGTEGIQYGTRGGQQGYSSTTEYGGDGSSIVTRHAGEALSSSDHKEEVSRTSRKEENSSNQGYSYSSSYSYSSGGKSTHDWVERQHDDEIFGRQQPMQIESSRRSTGGDHREMTAEETIIRDGRETVERTSTNQEQHSSRIEKETDTKVEERRTTKEDVEYRQTDKTEDRDNKDDATRGPKQRVTQRSKTGELPLDVNLAKQQIITSSFNTTEVIDASVPSTTNSTPAPEAGPGPDGASWTVVSGKQNGVCSSTDEFVFRSGTSTTEKTTSQDSSAKVVSSETTTRKEERTTTETKTPAITSQTTYSIETVSVPAAGKPTAIDSPVSSPVVEVKSIMKQTTSTTTSTSGSQQPNAPNITYYTQTKRISTEVSPTHEAFARSLRSSPEKTTIYPRASSKTSIDTNTSILSSPTRNQRISVTSPTGPGGIISDRPRDRTSPMKQSTPSPSASKEKRKLSSSLSRGMAPKRTATPGASPSTSPVRGRTPCSDDEDEPRKPTDVIPEKKRSIHRREGSPLSDQPLRKSPAKDTKTSSRKTPEKSPVRELPKEENADTTKVQRKISESVIKDVKTTSSTAVGRRPSKSPKEEKPVARKPSSDKLTSPSESLPKDKSPESPSKDRKPSEDRKSPPSSPQRPKDLDLKSRTSPGIKPSTPSSPLTDRTPVKPKEPSEIPESQPKTIEGDVFGPESGTPANKDKTPTRPILKPQRLEETFDVVCEVFPDDTLVKIVTPTMVVPDKPKEVIPTEESLISEVNFDLQSKEKYSMFPEDVPKEGKSKPFDDEPLEKPSGISEKEPSFRPSPEKQIDAPKVPEEEANRKPISFMQSETPTERPTRKDTLPERRSPTPEDREPLPTSRRTPVRDPPLRDTQKNESPSPATGSTSTRSPVRKSPAGRSPLRDRAQSGSPSPVRELTTSGSPQRKSPGKDLPDTSTLRQVSPSPERMKPTSRSPSRKTPEKDIPSQFTKKSPSPARESPVHSPSRQSPARGSPARDIIKVRPSEELPKSRKSPARDSPVRETPRKHSPSPLRETGKTSSPSRKSPIREVLKKETPRKQSPSPARESPKTPSKERKPFSEVNRESPPRKSPARETSIKDKPVRLSSERESPCRRPHEDRTTPERSPARKPSLKESPRKESPARKTPDRDTTRNSPSRQSPSKDSPKKTPERELPMKTPVRQSPAKELPGRKTVTRKSSERDLISEKESTTRRSHSSDIPAARKHLPFKDSPKTDDAPVLKSPVTEPSTRKSPPKETVVRKIPHYTSPSRQPPTTQDVINKESPSSDRPTAESPSADKPWRQSPYKSPVKETQPSEPQVKTPVKEYPPSGIPRTMSPARRPIGSMAPSSENPKQKEVKAPCTAVLYDKQPTNQRRSRSPEKIVPRKSSNETRQKPADKPVSRIPGRTPSSGTPSSPRRQTPTTSIPSYQSPLRRGPKEDSLPSPVKDTSEPKQPIGRPQLGNRPVGSPADRFTTHTTTTIETAKRPKKTKKKIPTTGTYSSEEEGSTTESEDEREVVEEKVVVTEKEIRRVNEMLLHDRGAQLYGIPNGTMPERPISLSLITSTKTTTSGSEVQQTIDSDGHIMTTTIHQPTTTTMSMSQTNRDIEGHEKVLTRTVKSTSYPDRPDEDEDVEIMEIDDGGKPAIEYPKDTDKRPGMKPIGDTPKRVSAPLKPSKTEPRQQIPTSIGRKPIPTESTKSAIFGEPSKKKNHTPSMTSPKTSAVKKAPTVKPGVTPSVPVSGQTSSKASPKSPGKSGQISRLPAKNIPKPGAKTTTTGRTTLQQQKVTVTTSTTSATNRQQNSRITSTVQNMSHPRQPLKGEPLIGCIAKKPTSKGRIPQKTGKPTPVKDTKKTVPKKKAPYTDEPEDEVVTEEDEDVDVETPIPSDVEIIDKFDYTDEVETTMAEKLISDVNKQTKVTHLIPEEKPASLHPSSAGATPTGITSSTEIRPISRESTPDAPGKRQPRYADRVSEPDDDEMYYDERTTLKGSRVQQDSYKRDHVERTMNVTIPRLETVEQKYADEEELEEFERVELERRHPVRPEQVTDLDEEETKPVGDDEDIEPATLSVSSKVSRFLAASVNASAPSHPSQPAKFSEPRRTPRTSWEPENHSPKHPKGDEVDQKTYITTDDNASYAVKRTRNIFETIAKAPELSPAPMSPKLKTDVLGKASFFETKHKEEVNQVRTTENIQRKSFTGSDESLGDDGLPKEKPRTVYTDSEEDFEDDIQKKEYPMKKPISKESSPARTFKSQIEYESPQEISPSRTFKPQNEKPKAREVSPVEKYSAKPEKPETTYPTEEPDDYYDEEELIYEDVSTEDESPRKASPLDRTPKTTSTKRTETETDVTRRRNVFRDTGATPSEDDQSPRVKKTSVGSTMGREAFLKRMSKFASTTEEKPKPLKPSNEAPKMKPLGKVPAGETPSSKRPRESVVEPTKDTVREKESPSRKAPTDSGLRRISTQEADETRRSPVRDTPRRPSDTFTRRPSRDHPKSSEESPRRTPSRETPTQRTEYGRKSIDETRTTTTDTFTRRSSKEIRKIDIPTKDVPSRQTDSPLKTREERTPLTDKFTRRPSKDRSLEDASPRRPQENYPRGTDTFTKKPRTNVEDSPKGSDTFTRRPSKEPRPHDDYPRRPSEPRESPQRESPRREYEDLPKTSGTYTRKKSTDRLKDSTPSPRSSPSRDTCTRRPVSDEVPRVPYQEEPEEPRLRGSDTFTRRRSQPRDDETEKTPSAVDALKPYLRTRNQEFPSDDQDKPGDDDRSPKKLNSSRFSTFTKRDSSTTIKDDIKSTLLPAADRTPKKLSGSRFEKFTKKDSSTSVKGTETVEYRTRTVASTVTTARKSVERETDTTERTVKAERVPSRKPSETRESPSRVDRRTPEKVDRRTPDRSDRKTPERSDRRTPDRREDSPASYGEPLRKKPTKELEDEPVRKAPRPEEEEVEARASMRRRPSKEGSPRPAAASPLRRPDDEVPDQPRRKSSGGKFGVVLRQTSSVGSRVEALMSKVEKKTGSITETVVLTPTRRRSSKGPETGLDIEEIFDLEFLENMLEKATDYDQRRRIRAQIRLVRRGEGREPSSQGTPSTPRDTPTSHAPSRPTTLGQTKGPRTPSTAVPQHPSSKEPSPAREDVEDGRRVKTRRGSSQPRDSPEREKVQPVGGRRKPSRAEEVGGELTSPSVVAKLLPSTGTPSSPAPSRPSTTPSATTPKKNSLTSTSSGLPREACPTDSITSSYGVGPTDDSGRPLFGLRALRRPQQQAPPESVPSAPAPSPNTQSREASVEPRPQSPETSDVRDSSGRPLFGLRAITISSGSKTTKEVRRVADRPKSPDTVERPDSQGPSEDEYEDEREMPSTSSTVTETSVQLRDLVRRHEQHARGNVPSQPVQLQKPRAKLRDSFILSQDEEEPEDSPSRPTVPEPQKGVSSPASKTFPSALPSSLTESGKVVADRSCNLKSIIQKHEKIADTETTNNKLNRRDSGLGAYTEEEDLVPAKNNYHSRSQDYSTDDEDEEYDDEDYQDFNNGERPETTTVKVTSDISKRPGILKKPKDNEVTESSTTTSTASTLRSQQTVSEKSSSYSSLKKDVIKGVDDSEDAAEEAPSADKRRPAKGTGRRPSNDAVDDESPATSSSRATYSSYTTSSSSSSVSKSGADLSERRRSSNTVPYTVEEVDGDSNDGIEVIRSPSDNRYSATTTTVTRRYTSSNDSPTVVSTTTTVTRSAGGRPGEDDDEVQETRVVKKKYQTTSSPSPAAPASATGFSRVARGGSVRALSQKFQQAAAEAASGVPDSPSRAYPKAGLIFRTASFRQQGSQPTPPSSPLSPCHSASSPTIPHSMATNGHSGTKTVSGETVERRSVTRGVAASQKDEVSGEYSEQLRRRSVENDRGSPLSTTRKSAGEMVTSVSSTSSSRVRQVSDGDDDDEEYRGGGGGVVTVEERTMVVTNGSGGSGSHGRSFLGNQSKVTGVQDVLSRMREADNEGPTEGDTVEDSEARALLNKFLGAQVILQGMEPLINAQSPSLVRQVEKQRVQKKQETSSVTTVYTSDTDLDGIWDERRLQQLLESCSDYDGRRKIRARIRTVMAEQKVTAAIVAEGRLEAEREESSGRSKALIPRQSSGDVAEAETTSTTVTRTVQGELLPLIVDQLKSSLEKRGEVGAGGGGGFRRGGSPGGSSSEEGPFDSGTESGEERKHRRRRRLQQQQQQQVQPTLLLQPMGTRSETAGGEDGDAEDEEEEEEEFVRVDGEFSSFMEGLKTSIEAAAARRRRERAPGDGEEEGQSRFEWGGREESRATGEMGKKGEMSGELLGEVHSALGKLQGTLQNSGNLDPEKSQALLSLISSLQTSLEQQQQSNLKDTPEVAVPQPPAAPQPRTAVPDWKARNQKKRQGRAHTVGVSKEELADARRLLEKCQQEDKYGEDGVEEEAVEERGTEERVGPMGSPSVQSESKGYSLMKQSSAGDLGPPSWATNSLAARVFRPVHFEPQRSPTWASMFNKTAKPFQREALGKNPPPNTPPPPPNPSKYPLRPPPLPPPPAQPQLAPTSASGVQPKDVPRGSADSSLTKAPPTKTEMSPIVNPPKLSLAAQPTKEEGVPYVSQNNHVIPGAASSQPAYHPPAPSQAYWPSPPYSTNPSSSQTSSVVTGRSNRESESSVTGSTSTKAETEEDDEEEGCFVAEGKLSLLSAPNSQVKVEVSGGDDDEGDDDDDDEENESEVVTQKEVYANGVTSHGANTIEPPTAPACYTPEKRSVHHSLSLDSGTAKEGLRVKEEGGGETVNRASPLARSWTLDDPSALLFTPAECVQIAVHKAAIKKQLSYEEEQRMRLRNKPIGAAESAAISEGPVVREGESLELNTTDFENVEYPPVIVKESSGSRSSSHLSESRTTSDEVSRTTSGSSVSSSASSRNSAGALNGIFESSEVKDTPNPPTVPPRRESIQGLPSYTSTTQQVITDNQYEKAKTEQDAKNSNLWSPSKKQNIPNYQNYVQTTVQHFLPNVNGQATHANDSIGHMQSNGFAKDSQEGDESALSNQSRAERIQNKMDKKRKMKRANTIDIPKPLNFYVNEDDYSSGDEDEGDDEMAILQGTGDGSAGLGTHRAAYLALRGPIRVKLPDTQVPLAPSFQAKTESDRKFLAFLEQHSGTATNKAEPAYHSSARGGAHWSNRFSNIKTSFEGTGRGSDFPNQTRGRGGGRGFARGGVNGPASARNFWRAADDSVTLSKVNSLEPRLSKEGSTLLRRLFEERDAAAHNQASSKKENSKRRSSEQVNKLPWAGDSHFKGEVAAKDSVVVGSLTVANKKQLFSAMKASPLTPEVKGPVPVGKFSHAPLSAFRPLPSKDQSSSSSNSSTPLSSPGAVRLATQKFSTTPITPPSPSSKPQSNLGGSRLGAKSPVHQKKTFVPMQECQSPKGGPPPWAKEDAHGRVMSSTARFEILSRDNSPPPPPPPTQVSYSSHSHVVHSHNIHPPPSQNVPQLLNLVQSTKSVAQPQSIAHPPSAPHGFVNQANVPTPPPRSNAPRTFAAQQQHPKEKPKPPPRPYSPPPPNLPPPPLVYSQPPPPLSVPTLPASQIEPPSPEAQLQCAAVAKVMAAPVLQQAVVQKRRKGGGDLMEEEDERETAAKSLSSALHHLSVSPCRPARTTPPSPPNPIDICQKESPVDSVRVYSSDTYLHPVHPSLRVDEPKVISHRETQPMQYIGYSQPGAATRQHVQDSICEDSQTKKILPPDQEEFYRRQLFAVQEAQRAQKQLEETQNEYLSYPSLHQHSPTQGYQSPKTHKVQHASLTSDTKELNDESVVTMRLQIPVKESEWNVPNREAMSLSPFQKEVGALRSNSYHDLRRAVASVPLPEERRPTPKRELDDRSPTSVLQKSESWHLLSQLGSTSPNSKRPQSLALDQNKRRVPTALPKMSFPKQFEARLSPETVETKQKRVEAYLKGQGTGTPPPARRKIKVQEASPPLLLDDNLENVDEAFESLFNAATMAQDRRVSGEKGEVTNKSYKASQKVLLSKSQSQQHLLRPPAPPRESSSSPQFQRKQKAWEESCMVKTKLAQNLSGSHSEATTMSSSTDSSVTKTEVHTKSSNYSATVTGKSRVSKAPPSKTMSPFAKFKQLDEQNASSAPNSPKSPGGTGPLFKFTDPQLSRSASGVKDKLLYWCQMKTKEYKNIQIENFSTSWSNGLAFCALIHHFCPEAFDYDTLRPEERRKNFELAFQVADDKAGIAPLLDVEDMVMMRKPDWKCVFTYVQSIYRRFKDED